MPSFEIRPANTNDVARLMALDHSVLSDYVWQLELRRDVGQTSANFREVRLPRSVVVAYPRNPLALAEEWTRRDVVLAALKDETLVGYTCATVEHTSAIAWVTDIVVASDKRRQGVASALLAAIQAWAWKEAFTVLSLKCNRKINLAFALHRSLAMSSAGIMTNITRLRMWLCSLGEH